MRSEIDIPELADSGADGHQVKGDIIQAFVEPQPVGRPIAKAISGLAASNTRAFGSEAVSVLIVGVISQMSAELDQTRKELNDQRGKNEKLALDLLNEKIKSSVLAERIDSFRSSRHLKNVGISVGSLMLGLGAKLLITSESPAYGIVGVAIGSILILFSWASAPKGGDK